MRVAFCEYFISDEIRECFLDCLRMMDFKSPSKSRPNKSRSAIFEMICPSGHIEPLSHIKLPPNNITFPSPILFWITFATLAKCFSVVAEKYRENNKL